MFLERKKHDLYYFIFIGESTNPRTTSSHGIDFFLLHLSLFLARVFLSKLLYMCTYFVQYPIAGFRNRDTEEKERNKEKRMVDMCFLWVLYSVCLVS